MPDQPLSLAPLPAGQRPLRPIFLGSKYVTTQGSTSNPPKMRRNKGHWLRLRPWCIRILFTNGEFLNAQKTKTKLRVSEFTVSTLISKVTRQNNRCLCNHGQHETYLPVGLIVGSWLNKKKRNFSEPLHVVSDFRSRTNPWPKFKVSPFFWPKKVIEFQSSHGAFWHVRKVRPGKWPCANPFMSTKHMDHWSPVWVFHP